MYLHCFCFPKEMEGFWEIRYMYSIYIHIHVHVQCGCSSAAPHGLCAYEHMYLWCCRVQCPCIAYRVML